MKKRYLALANGDVFEGTAFGAEAESTGELVFTTGAGGYIETLTDPSYYGQIILQTFPLIGNYGMIAADYESEICHARGYVVREWCAAPSNFRCEETVDAFLKRQNVPGIAGVDTRQITRVIRDHGVMNAKIVDQVTDTIQDTLKTYTIKNAIAGVSANEKAEYPANEHKHRVALIDYGAKHNIIRELNKRGCDVILLPYTATAEEILSIHPDGLMLSNGPGDPAENTQPIATLQELLGKLPVFGICLGHQLLALAAGARTVKLKFGHRGANQPVKRLSDGAMFITCQNHGYAVETDSLPKKARVSYQNANDFTCEGVEYPDLNAFSVQFHPEACSGPRDTNYLFDTFVEKMGGPICR